MVVTWAFVVAQCTVLACQMMASSPTNAPAKMRIDKWLWAARIYKTRSVASDAISKNRVKVDGQRIKPSRTIQVGDTIQYEKPPYRFDIKVLGLNDKRRPASEASLMYEESAESIAARESQSISSRLDYQMQSGLAGSGRPSKKQRRQIIRFQNMHDVPFVADDTATDSGAKEKPE